MAEILALTGDTANGLNWLGFSGNGRGYTYNFTDIANTTYFYLWSSEDYSSSFYAWTLVMSAYANTSNYEKSTGRSVRCIQDQAEE